MNKKLVIGVLIGLGLLFVVACTKPELIVSTEKFANVTKMTEQEKINRNNLLDAKIDLDNLETGAVRRIRELYQPNREEYGNATLLFDLNGELIPVSVEIKSLIEKDLPPLPSDFWKVKYNFISGNVNICDLEPEYYMQPEFVGVFDNEQQSMFTRVYMPMIKEVTNTTIWYRTGFTGFPSVHRLITIPNNKAKFCVLVYSSFRVQTFQGFKVSMVDTNKIVFPYEEKKIVEFSVDKSAFDITIAEPNILLEPVIPEFNRGWVQKLEFELTTYNKTGQYAVKLDLGYPSSEKSSEWHNQYGALYEAGNPFIIDVPIFQAIVDIRDANTE